MPAEQRPRLRGQWLVSRTADRGLLRPEGPPSFCTFPENCHSGQKVPSPLCQGTPSCVSVWASCSCSVRPCLSCTVPWRPAPRLSRSSTRGRREAGCTRVSKPEQRELIPSFWVVSPFWVLAGHPIPTWVKKLLLALPGPLWQPFPVFHSCSSPGTPVPERAPLPGRAGFLSPVSH